MINKGMRYLSTKGLHETDLIGAIGRGLAPDGRLYVPEKLPNFNPQKIQGESLAEIAIELLDPFFVGSPLEEYLESICKDAFNFPVPLEELEKGKLAVLELFHGPTAAFKDIGARFLAAVMERSLRGLRLKDDRPLTILVATSGDTGGAVAAAFHGRSGMRVAVFFPNGQVSPRQKHQLTCWTGNVRSYEVNGSFDQCQALLKSAFTDVVLREKHQLSAANSINIGRLLPQAVYHAAASIWHWRKHGSKASFIVPAGNLGNALACVWARAMGMPIRDIILSTNSNKVIPEFLSTGAWQPRCSIQTLASAMDVGNPSNMERLRHLIPDFLDLRTSIEAYSVSDAAIIKQITSDHVRRGKIWCPHTATGFSVYDQLPVSRRKSNAWIVVATAHPAKFDHIVEKAIGARISVPPSLEALLELPTNYEKIEPNIGVLNSILND